MCGRYILQRSPAEIARYFETTNATPNFAPSWNLAPTETGLVVRRHPGSGERHLDVLRWGLVPRWAKDPTGAARLMNARSEGITGKPSFREAFARRRCLVPADGFLEWLSPAESTRSKAPKQPFAVALRDGTPMALAGLWEGWQAPDGSWLRTYTIVTTEANAKQAPLHHRMPVILAPADWPAWLGEEEVPEQAVHALLRPCLPEWLACWPVDPLVNKATEKDPGLLRRHPLAMPPPELDDEPPDWVPRAGP